MKDKQIEAESIEKLKEANKEIVVTKIMDKLKELEQEISERNEYMNERDLLLYDSDYIMQDLDLKAGAFSTKYNKLPRAVEIHTSQVMGRGFTPVVRYDKESPELAPEKQEEIKLKNERIASQAQNAKNLVETVFKLNGGNSIWKTLAKTASSYGTGLLKQWIDWEENIVRLVAIESPQNFVAGWSSDNFRERDFDAMLSQISLDKANAMYSEKLYGGATEFKAEKKTANNDTLTDQTSRPMVNVIDFVGIVPGINKDKPFMAKIVGGYLVGYETRKQYFPKYYIFPNRIKLRRPWGESDLTDEAIDINKTYIQKASDYDTLINKTMFDKYMAKGFDDTNIPKAEQREVQVFPMDQAQSIELIQHGQFAYPFKETMQECKDNLAQALAVSRVMLDDPNISFESSQAMMTGMKSTIDVAEDKQDRWTETLIDVCRDIADNLIELESKLKGLMGDDYKFDIEWPSVMRKEDASYRTMLFNDVSRGFMSLETYLEKVGHSNVDEELDRIKSDLEDPIIGSIMSANARMLNQLMLQGIAAITQPQPQATGAPLTTGQNQEQTQPASAPGSGAPGVSPEGAAMTTNQNMGA